MSQEFNPKQYRGKDIVYIAVPGCQGICTIWDWDSQKTKYVRRTSGHQYYAFKKINGDQKSRCFDGFAQAKLWRDEGDLFVEDASAEKNFSEVKSEYFSWVRGRIEVTSFETYESNAKHLGFLDALPMSQLTAKAIDRWLMAVKKKEYIEMQHRTRISYQPELSLLGYILKYYIEYHNDHFQFPIQKRHRRDCIVDLVKYKQSKDRNKKHFIPRADFEKFLEGVLQRALEKPDRLVFAALAEFQLGSGCRIGEACAIDFSDVLDWESGTVRISKTIQWSRKKGRPTRISELTKTSDSRIVYISRRALDVLKQWRTYCQRKNGLIFSYDGSEPLSYRCVQHHFDIVFETLGMKWRSTHILRHSYSTDFLEKTKDKVALQGQLGHRSSRQTDHYAKVTASAQKDGVLAYNERIENVIPFRAPVERENTDRLGEAGRTGVSQFVEKQKAP